MDLTALQKEISAKLEAVGPDQTVWAKRRTVQSWAGLKTASRASVAAMNAGLEEDGIYTSPNLSAARLSDTVHFSRRRFDDPGDRFKTEDALQKYLVLMAPTIRAFRGCKDLHQQYPVPGTKMKADLVGIGPKRLLICELKLGDGSFGVTTQLLSYMDEFIAAERRSDTPRSVEGLIITGTSNPKRQAELFAGAAERNIRVQWLLYHHHFELRVPGQTPPVSPTMPGR